MRWRPTSQAEGVHYERQVREEQGASACARALPQLSLSPTRSLSLDSRRPCCHPPPWPQLLNMLRRPYAQSDVPVGPGRQDFIHTVTGGAANGPDAPAFVAIPGYSTGSAFLFKLFDGLSAAFRLYAVDLLGTGLSGERGRLLPSATSGRRLAWRPLLRLTPEAACARHSWGACCHCCCSLRLAPTCPLTRAPAPRAGRPPFRARNTAEAEAFFVDSLEAWRREQGLDKVVLCGHSMGGARQAEAGSRPAAGRRQRHGREEGPQGRRPVGRRTAPDQRLKRAPPAPLPTAAAAGYLSGRSLDASVVPGAAACLRGIASRPGAADASRAPPSPPTRLQPATPWRTRSACST